MRRKSIRLTFDESLLREVDMECESRGFPSRSTFFRHLAEQSIRRRRFSWWHPPTKEDAKDVERHVLAIARAVGSKNPITIGNAFIELNLILDRIKDWWDMEAIGPIFAGLQARDLAPESMLPRLKLVGSGLHNNFRLHGSILAQEKLTGLIVGSGVLDGKWQCMDARSRDDVRQAASEALYWAVDVEKCLIPLARNHLIGALVALPPNEAKSARIKSILSRRLCGRHAVAIRRKIRGLTKRQQDLARRQFLMDVHDAI
jgi:hypothetical protein